jgi:AcrR family transcriptional regulator
MEAKPKTSLVGAKAQTAGVDAKPHPAERGQTNTVDRRQAILDAALTEFTAHGVAGASIDAIRRRSGASVGSIYHHFADKDAIAGALYLEGLRDYQQGFLAALEEAATTHDGIEAGVHHHLGWIAQRRELARFLLLGRDARTVVATERPLRELNRRFFAEVSNWMRPRIERGEVRALAPELQTALWIGPSQDVARHWLAGRTRGSLIDAAPVLADAAWRCLCP